ncbi:MAG: ATP-dependent sacrificial sulfur transferase LarE [Thermodesulfobacteriota bacterium]
MSRGGLGRKREGLEGRLRACGRIAVAWSGGADSTLLLAVAGRLLPGRVTALHAHTSVHTAAERQHVETMAAELGIALRIVEEDPLSWPEFVANPANRCYLCKKRLYRRFVELAGREGLGRLLDGTNADDLGEERPGLQALAELGIGTPLADSGLTKAEVRELSAQLGLATWNRPSNSCLATRIPHGTAIDGKTIATVAAAESVLHQAGFPNCRVRIVGGGWALVELRGGGADRTLWQGRGAEVVRELRRLGCGKVFLEIDAG